MHTQPSHWLHAISIPKTGCHHTWSELIPLLKRVGIRCLYIIHSYQLVVGTQSSIFFQLPPSCDDKVMMFLLAYHGRSRWVRPKDIGIAKARSSTRINYESKGGPNMGMGHSKGTSHVKSDILCMVDKDIYSFCPSMG